MEKFEFINSDLPTEPIHTPLSELSLDHQKFDVINQEIIELIKDPPAKKILSITEKQAIIEHMLSTSDGLTQLAASMTNPLRTRMDWAGIARRAVLVEPMPEGALPFYDRDVEIPGNNLTRV
jgi:hypothetical protein